MPQGHVAHAPPFFRILVCTSIYYNLVIKIVKFGGSTYSLLCSRHVSRARKIIVLDWTSSIHLHEYQSVFFSGFCSCIRSHRHRTPITHGMLSDLGILRDILPPSCERTCESLRTHTQRATRWSHGLCELSNQFGSGLLTQTSNR